MRGYEAMLRTAHEFGIPVTPVIEEDERPSRTRETKEPGKKTRRMHRDKAPFLILAHLAKYKDQEITQADLRKAFPKEQAHNISQIICDHVEIGDAKEVEMGAYQITEQGLRVVNSK